MSILSVQAEATGPHDRVVLPLRVAARGRNLVVRDATQRAVTWLRGERFEPGEIDEIVSELVVAVNQYAVASESKRVLAESLGRELSWDAICEAVNDLVDERKRMLATIGELRGRISAFEA